MLDITQQQLEKFRKIKNSYYGKTKFPERDNWKNLSNNDIWLRTFTQVMVAGSSNSFKEFSKNPTLKNTISYENLSRTVEQEDLRKKINQTLRAVGSRYAMTEYSKCLKTKALFHNFKVLLSTDGGPKGFLAKLIELNGDEQRMWFLAKSFMYIKNKGARDLLMELGILENSIAFDTRIKNILEKLGFVLPKGFEKNPNQYAEVERDLLTKVCKPLGITGVEFDRMLYQNYEEIMREIR